MRRVNEPSPVLLLQNDCGNKQCRFAMSTKGQLITIRIVGIFSLENRKERAGCSGVHYPAALQDLSHCDALQ